MRTAFFASLWLAALPAYANPWASRTGKYVGFLVDFEKKVSVWDLREGKEVARLFNGINGKSDLDLPRIVTCSISEDEMLVATGTDEGTSMWDLTTGELLWEDWRANNEEKENCRQVSAVAFFPNGREIASVSNGRLYVRQSRNGEGRKLVDEARAWTGPEGLAISPDGRRIYAYLDNGQQLRCWDSSDRTMLGDFRFSGDEITYRTGAFAVGNEYMVETCRRGRDDCLIVWDVGRIAETRKFTFVTFEGQRPSLLEDENVVIHAVKLNNLIRVNEFDIGTGKVKSAPHKIASDAIDLQFGCSLIAIPGTRSLCWTGGGGLVLAERPFSSERPYSVIFKTFSERRQSAAILFGGTRGVITGNPKRILFPKNEWISLLKGGDNFDRNEQWGSRELSPQSVTQDPVALKQQLTKLAEPIPGRSVKKSDRSNPRLFLLSIGISEYAQKEYGVKHAAEDAKMLTERIQAGSATFFSDVLTKVYLNKRATPTTIREGLAWLKQSSTESDIVMLLFAGHAIKAKKGAYLMSHTGDEEDIHNTCVALSEFIGSLAETKAAEIVLLVDCVQSKAISKERTLNQEEFAKALGQSEKLTVLASISEEDPTAKANQDIQHRAFTRALLEGLGGQADNDKNGEITWAELASYAPKRVSEMTETKQIPVVFKSTPKVANLRLSVVPKNRVP